MSSKRTTMGAKKQDVILQAAVLAGLLIMAIPFAISGQGVAYAQGNTTANQENDANDKSQSASNNNSQAGGNHTSTESLGMSQADKHRQNGNNTGTTGGNSTHSKAEEKRMEYARKTANEIHREHLAIHSEIPGSYHQDMNYTFTASGNATAVSDNSTSTNASVSMELSVWKTTDGLVSMDIMNGTVKIGSNETLQIHSGQAYYLIHTHQFRALAFIIDNTNSTSNANSQGNETASVSLKLLKLYSASDKNGSNLLPKSSSDTPLQVNILSPQSKLASEWFLNMKGEVKAG